VLVGDHRTAAADATALVPALDGEPRAVATDAAMSAVLTAPEAGCQLDTNIHLWRITAHNAVHRCEVAEMLKAPPHDFRAGAVAPTAPHKPAELGDPGDGLA